MAEAFATALVTERGFPLCDESNVPEESRGLFESIQRRAGAVTNLVRLLAGSPRLLEAYAVLNAVIDKSSFSRAEKQIIMLTVSYVNGCEYCMAGHSSSARRQRIGDSIVDALRNGEALQDPRLEALRRMTAGVARDRGRVSGRELNDFLNAGYSREQVLELLAFVALKTITNYADKLAHIPLDEQYQAELWALPQHEMAATAAGDR